MNVLITMVDGGFDCCVHGDIETNFFELVKAENKGFSDSEIKEMFDNGLYSADDKGSFDIIVTESHKI